jgi:hypothetical protein
VVSHHVPAADGFTRHCLREICRLIVSVVALKSSWTSVQFLTRASKNKSGTLPQMSIGSFSTDPAGLAWRLMSALAQKRF